MANRTTKFQKLLKRLQTKPMTYTEIKKFLSKGNYSGRPTNLYDPSLYGTSTREGILPRFCLKNSDGKYYVPEGTVITGPATPLRSWYRLTPN